MSAPEPAPLHDPSEDPAMPEARSDELAAEDPAGDDPGGDDDPPADDPAADRPRTEGSSSEARNGAEPDQGSRSAASRAAARRSVAVLGDRVLVAPPEDTERKSKGGILIPATARSIDRRGIWGEAIGVGPHVRQLGVGDEVLYLPEDAIEVDVQGDAYLIVRERDVHAVASARRDGATGLYL